LRIGRSIVARTDNGRYKQAIRCVEFSLSTLIGKHGFGDGDALISRDDDYLSYVQREAQAAITAAGLSGEIVRFETHHNPIRLVGDLRLHGRIVEDPERELAGHRFRVWALDLATQTRSSGAIRTLRVSRRAQHQLARQLRRSAPDVSRRRRARPGRRFAFEAHRPSPRCNLVF
jgi:hypothetical protein